MLRAVTHLADEAGGRALAHPQTELPLLPLAELPLGAGGDEDWVLIDQRLMEHLRESRERAKRERKEERKKRELTYKCKKMERERGGDKAAPQTAPPFISYDYIRGQLSGAHLLLFTIKRQHNYPVQLKAKFLP